MAAPNLEREAILRQAAEAKSLLEHPMLIAALKAMETLSIQEFVRSKPDDHDARTRAYWRSTAAAEFRSLLTRFVTTGRLEEEAASRADVEAKAADLPNTDADTPNARRISL